MPINLPLNEGEGGGESLFDPHERDIKTSNACLCQSRG